MLAAEIRARFLKYFERNGHVIRPSSSLVPGDDPTLLFTNAGMVQFKKVFLGMEEPPAGSRRATTSQKCVRAGGKHNDAEEVAHTARHHTFIEGSEAGRFLEFWNLVFMQYDKQPDGTLVPLPKPSVDTGAGLDRISAFMQGVTTNYHADGFAPLLAAVEEAVGIPYWGRE